MIGSIFDNFDYLCYPCLISFGQFLGTFFGSISISERHGISPDWPAPRA
jgi:hypothetical protein